MTGSSQAATVAKTNLDRFIQILLPSAVAMTPPTLVDSMGTTVTLNTAWVIIKEVEFKAAETAGEESASEADEEVQFKGPYFVDLLSSAPSPLDTQELPAKNYKRIKMQFENDCDDAVMPATAPTELGTNSMVFKGLVGGNAFSYLADDGVELELSGAGGVSASDGQNILVSVQIANIIKMIDMSSVTNNVVISSSNRVTASGACPLIDASANDLYTCFKKGFELEADFGKDEDDSGEIEDDEDHSED